MRELPEQTRDDAAAFVLGALNELEQQAFRQEMMKDCELGRYVEQLEQVGDVMLMSAAPVAVPDSLGESIMAEATRDLAAREILESPRGGEQPSQARPRLLDRLLKPAVGLGLAAVIAVGAFFAGQSISERGDENVTASFAGLAAAEVSGTVETIEGGDGGAIVQIEGLENDIDGDVYQLWVLKDGAVTASSLFTVDSSGAGSSIVPTDVSEAEAVMVTREPAGGSAQPTSDVLARADI